MYRLQEVEVTATRATPTTPVAYSDIRREEIARNSYGTDIPTLLALTPSMIATNETGIGIGGTSIRLRGTISWPGFGRDGEDWFGFVFVVDDFIGEPPAFDAIVDRLRALETTINGYGIA